MRAIAFRFVAAFLLIAGAAAPVLAGELNQSLFGTEVEGYDVVAYHRLGRAVEGSSEFTHEWRGATWRFSTAEHRDLFAAAPERFAPRYGGFCAYAVSQGGTAPIDPQAWKIVDDELYLNLSPEIQQIWEQDIPGYIEQADRNWPGLSAD